VWENGNVNCKEKKDMSGAGTVRKIYFERQAAVRTSRIMNAEKRKKRTNVHALDHWERGVERHPLMTEIRRDSPDGSEQVTTTGHQQCTIDFGTKGCLKKKQRTQQKLGQEKEMVKTDTLSVRGGMCLTFTQRGKKKQPGLCQRDAGVIPGKERSTVW